MQYIGKKLLKYGDMEFIGDEYLMPISSDLFTQLISVATKTQLNGLLEEQLRFEDYEAAQLISEKLNTL